MIGARPPQAMKVVHGRATAALLNPRPVVLVTCCDEHGRPNVLSVAWQTPLSHEPPLVGISIEAGRFSHRLIEQVGEFGLNVVDETFRDAVERCGNLSGRDVDKAAIAGLSLIPARSIRPPLVAGALAHIECEVQDRIRTGTHTFFVGVVRHAQVREDGFDDAWSPAHANVLLCLQRDRFGTWVHQNL